jgi:hypothetical protein
MNLNVRNCGRDTKNLNFPSNAVQTYGGVDVQLHTFLTLALVEVLACFILLERANKYPEVQRCVDTPYRASTVARLLPWLRAKPRSQPLA